YQLASVYELLGRDNAAEESFKKAISLYPRYEEAMLALAVLYEKLGKNTGAEIQYKKALKIKPGDGVARLRLANMIAKAGRKSEALEIMSRAFLISPLSEEGLALSISYAGKPQTSTNAQTGGENENVPQPQDDKVLDNFKKRLTKVPSSKQINIEVDIKLAPKQITPKVEKSPDGDFIRPRGALASAVESLQKQENSAAFSRSFILAGVDDKERKEQLDKIFNDLENVLNQAAEKYEVDLSLRANAQISNNGILGEAAIGPEPIFSMGANAKAGYNPYMVGNDMGLWTPNKSWVVYINEIMPEILNRLANSPHDYIIAGLAAIELGKAADALEYFNRAAFLGANIKNVDEAKELLQIINLGKGTVYIVLGDEAAALKEYKTVLELNPSNEIAKANVEILEK
ncbi:MAG: hypothetical protein LBG46_03735, partial [Elusimicrobiota bacterium]|nr:hypothetical protein [Elusimicrobiota bacterium]